MAPGKFVSYLRVSTDRQGRSGLGLEAQRKAVDEYLNGGNGHLTTEVVEIESGKRSDRPKLAEALRLCRLHGAVLIIAKLDRLARNVAFISNVGADPWGHPRICVSSLLSGSSDLQPPGPFLRGKLKGGKKALFRAAD